MLRVSHSLGEIRGGTPLRIAKERASVNAPFFHSTGICKLSWFDLSALQTALRLLPKRCATEGRRAWDLRLVFVVEIRHAKARLKPTCRRAVSARQADYGLSSSFALLVPPLFSADYHYRLMLRNLSNSLLILLASALSREHSYSSEHSRWALRDFSCALAAGPEGSFTPA